MKNKKGISAIVATVLIILITVAAVTIIWAAIIPMIQDQIGGSQECLAATSALSISTDFSCVAHGTCNGLTGVKEADCVGTWLADATAGGKLDVQVALGTGSFTLTDVEIVYGAGGTTESTRIVDADGLNLGVEFLPSTNGERVYTINYTGAKVETASVVAIVKAGGTSKSCERSGDVQIPVCAGFA